MKRRALVTLMVALALLLIATTIKSGWLYLVSSAVFSLLIIGRISGWRATRKVGVERQCSPEVFEGEPLTVRLRVINEGRMARYLLSVRDLQFARAGRRGALGRVREYREEMKRMTGRREPASPGGRGADGGGEGGERTVTVERLGPGSSVEVTYELKAPRRGVYEEAELSVGSGGLFGNVDVERSLKIPSPVTVFPRIYPLESFPMHPDLAASPAESFEWSRKGMGQDYYGVREYTRGDSLRYIHWRSSARRGRLIVKEYQQELNPPAVLVVLLDRPRYGTRDSNSLEDGLRAVASIINYYSTRGRAPGLVVPGGESFEFFDGGTVGEMFGALAGYRPPRAGGGIDASRLENAISFARNAFMSGYALVVVTNIAGDSLWPATHMIGGLGGGSLVLVADESYAGGGGAWRPRTTGVPGDLLPGSEVNLYLLTRGRGFNECLSEPLSITV